MQALEFSAAPGGGVDTTWSASLDGKVRNATYTLDLAGPGVLTTAYKLFSMPVEETYFILDYTEDGAFLLYLYCGALLGSEYTGAVGPPRCAARRCRPPHQTGLGSQQPAVAAIPTGLRGMAAPAEDLCAWPAPHQPQHSCHGCLPSPLSASHEHALHLYTLFTTTGPAPPSLLQLIYSREPGAAVPPDVAARFSTAVQAAGLQDYVQLDRFCSPAYPPDCPTM